MVEDLAQLVKTLETRHPGLHRFTNKEEFQRLLEKTRGQTHVPRSDVEFFRAVAPLVAAVRCGHTAMRPDGTFLKSIVENAKQLPCEVRFVGPRTYITKWDAPSSELPNGCELLSIDGVTTIELRKRMLPSIRGDGLVATGKMRELEKQFALHYTILIDTKATGEFDLEIQQAGGQAAVKTVAGRRFQPPKRSASAAPIEFRLGDDRIAFLTVRTFSSGAMKRSSVDYRALLKNTFQELQQKKVRKLVLDLRGNSGGTDQMGAHLVSYLCPRPFGYFEAIEVAASYQGMGGVETDSVGRRIITEHPGLRRQQPADDAFIGDLVVLIDGNTFSTAADVATVLHYQKLGTFLGEECGGGYDGNCSGMMHTELLRNSKIAVRIPLWKYTTSAAGHKHAGRGVPVDRAIQPSINDILTGADPVLRHAIERLR